MPGDALYLLKAAHVELVESTLLAGVQGPTFTAIKQSAEPAGFIRERFLDMVDPRYTNLSTLPSCSRVFERWNAGRRLVLRRWSS